jgi:hypothetical protein
MARWPSSPSDIRNDSRDWAVPRAPGDSADERLLRGAIDAGDGDRSYRCDAFSALTGESIGSCCRTFEFDVAAMAVDSVSGCMSAVVVGDEEQYASHQFPFGGASEPSIVGLRDSRRWDDLPSSRRGSSRCSGSARTSSASRGRSRSVLHGLPDLRLRLQRRRTRGVWALLRVAAVLVDVNWALANGSLFAVVQALPRELRV